MAFFVDCIVWYKAKDIKFQDDEPGDEEETVPFNEAIPQRESSVWLKHNETQFLKKWYKALGDFVNRTKESSDFQASWKSDWMRSWSPKNGCNHAGY